MSSIGGLAQSQYGAPYGIGGLAQYLNNTSTGSGSSAGGASSGLASLLGGSGGGGGGGGSSSDKSMLGYSPPSYDFPTDSRGQPVVATLSDMAAAAKPGDRLTIAGQIGEAIRMQSDCSVRGGRADRIADMTTQTQTLLDAVGTVVSNVATTDGSVAAGKADPAVTPYQSSLSTVLGRVASVVANLQVLTSKASPDVASQTKSALATLSAKAQSLAAQAGLDWSALSKAGMTSLTSGSSLASIPRLIDYLA